jgi:hypothetical protein
MLRSAFQSTMWHQQVMLRRGRLYLPIGTQNLLLRHEIEVWGPTHLYQIEGSTYRSTSPKTISCVPIMVTTSASMWFLAIKSSPCK